MATALTPDARAAAYMTIAASKLRNHLCMSDGCFDIATGPGMRCVKHHNAPTPRLCIECKSAPAVTTMGTTGIYCSPCIRTRPAVMDAARGKSASKTVTRTQPASTLSSNRRCVNCGARSTMSTGQLCARCRANANRAIARA